MAPDLTPRTPVREVATLRLESQTAVLADAVTAIGRGEDTGVHDARVAARRLLGALSSFEPALRAEVREPARRELRWFARALGRRRDEEVVRARLLLLLQRDPAAPEGAAWLVARLGAAPAGEGDAVAASARCAALQERLPAVTADPAWTRDAGRGAGSFLRPRIAADWDRLAGRVARLPEGPVDAETAELLHDVRKAGKRLRYALEVAGLVWRRQPTRLRKSVQLLTEVLGEHQDVLLTTAELRRLVAEAPRAGEPTAALTGLLRAEEARAADLVAQFRAYWPTVVERRGAWP